MGIKAAEEGGLRTALAFLSPLIVMRGLRELLLMASIVVRNGCTKGGSSSKSFTDASGITLLSSKSTITTCSHKSQINIWKDKRLDGGGGQTSSMACESFFNSCTLVRRIPTT